MNQAYMMQARDGLLAAAQRCEDKSRTPHYSETSRIHLAKIAASKRDAAAIINQAMKIVRTWHHYFGPERPNDIIL